MEGIQLVNMSTEEFRSIVRDEVSAKLNQLLREIKPEEVELMTETAACRLIRINPRTLKRMSAQGIIPCIPIGNGRYRYSRKALIENIERINQLKYTRHE